MYYLSVTDRQIVQETKFDSDYICHKKCEKYKR